MRVGDTAKRILYVAGAVASLAITGCGGGSGSAGNQLTSVSGVVADGYLEKAKVFLDLNDDKKFTAGEPTATTGVDGSYTLTGVSAEQLKNHAIVVLAEQNVTINHEGSGAGTPVADAYVLSTPPDAPKDADGKVVITPLTTLIHNQIESNPALSVTAAEASVKSNLGVADNTSLFADFVQKKGASDDYDKLSKVSQVVATAIGNNMTAIHDAAPDANLNDVIKVIVAEVMTQLANISSTVATTSNFDAATIATTTVKVDTSDATTLKDNLAQAGTATVVSSFQTALGTDGFFSVGKQYDNNQVYYEYGVVKLGASTTTGYSLTEEDFIYTALNPTWTASANTNNDYALGTSGWAPSDDKASSGRLVFNSDGTATWTLIASGRSQIISVSKIDVAGKSISTFLKDAPVTADAVFPAGAEAYKMTFVPQSDNYTVWMGGTNYDLNQVDSLTALVAKFAPGSQYPLHIGMNLAVKFATDDKKTAQFFLQQSYAYQAEPLPLTGTWKIVEPVTGYPVLILDVPFAYKSMYMDDNPSRNVIFALVDGVIRQGDVEYAKVPRSDKELNFNKIAFTAIKDNFTPVWTSPGTSPSVAKKAKAVAKSARIMHF